MRLRLPQRSMPQVAPTILELLGLDPSGLTGAAAEGTSALPGLVAA